MAARPTSAIRPVGVAERHANGEGIAAAHRGVSAVQRLVEFAPGSGGLALWVHHKDLEEGALPGCIATDGCTLFYAPGFARLLVSEQAGWVAHAVLHIALRHAQRLVALRGRIGDVDHALFNLCADAIVNSSLAPLSWLELPRAGVRLERLLEVSLGLKVSAEQALLEWDLERVYRALDDRQMTAGTGTADQRRIDGPRAARARVLGASSVRDLVVGKNTLVAPEQEAEHAREWTERTTRAHAGDGAFSLLRALPADLRGSRTPWQYILRARLARGLANRPALSWSRPTRSYLANQGRAGPHRRMPWEPGISPVRSVPRLVVVIDVSGSIDELLLTQFSAELESAMRRLEATMVVVIGDDRVREVRHWRPGHAFLHGLSFAGGGGTDFSPLLQEAGRHRPDLVLVLTDLAGPAGPTPRWPVIWAVPPASADATVPFGKRIVLA